ncbi:MAG: hypothetical protein V3W34_08990 [Phycisphaerae bacterium]
MTGPMKILTDAYERTIDEKNRIQIAAPHRNVLDPERQGAVLYVVPGERIGTLSLYPEEYFERKARSIPTDQIPGRDALDFEQMFFAMASRVEMDKQGRLVLPERQLAAAELGKEIYITGARYRLDLWNRADYEEFLREVLSRRTELQSFLRTPMQPAAKERSE